MAPISPAVANSLIRFSVLDFFFEEGRND
jgi:hypothetical protein